jgi:hypothetical protein
VSLTAIILMLRDRGNITKLPKKKGAAELSSSIAEAFKICQSVNYVLLGHVYTCLDSLYTLYSFLL